MRARIGKDLESQRQQSIACKDRGRLVERLVHRRAPPPQIVVVHRGEVIMDQGIAMHAFQRAGRVQRLLHAHAEQGRALDHEERPEPLAAAERAIAHRFQQPRRNRAEAFSRQPMVEMAFNTACMGFEAFCKSHGENCNCWRADDACARTMDHVSAMLKRVL